MPLVACPHCGAQLDSPPDLMGKQVTCSTCRRVFTAQPAPPAIPTIPVLGPAGARWGAQGTPPAPPQSTNRLAAGICAILIGHFGVHKFILGYTGAGLTMLLVSILGCGVGAVVMWVIGIVEGITYLTKSDAEFHQTYEVGRKEWF